MIETLGGMPAWPLLVAAGFLLLLNLALNVALVSAASLSPVSLRRLSSDSGPRWHFLESLEDPASAHRLAGSIARQLTLLGAVLLVSWAAGLAGLSLPGVTGVAVGALIGVVLLESLAARAIAGWSPRRALRAAAPVVLVAHTVLFVIVRPLHAVVDRIGRKRAVSEEQREEEQDEEVEALFEVGEREGLLEATESEMMRGIVDLDERPVREIMTPRTDIVAVLVDTTVAEARTVLMEAGHSRIPVYRGSVDNVVGVLHSRDLFRAWEQGTDDEPVSRYLRAASFVPESLSAGELLKGMRQTAHLAIVVDEYGGTAGLVTLEDLIEEIVGDIRDEHEDEEDEIRPEADGVYMISAAAHVDELEKLFGVEFEGRNFDTVGGLVVHRFGRVPSAGEILDVEGLRLEVLQAERRRVHRVRVRRKHPTDEAQAGS
ncbi:MAG: HlyC/CorC family transporter [bacterium]|nr:HlyC/CorC family transporter [bacterium]